MSDLDLLWPEEPGSAQVTVVASVRSVDAAARLVKVQMPGGSLLELAAMPGRYRVTDTPGAGLARVLLEGGRPVLVLGAVDPLDPVVPASMTATGATTATVSWNGSSYTLPFVPATYGALPRDVWVALSDWGVPALVHGPSATAPPPPPPPPPPPETGSTVQVTQMISPQWSGTWRAIRGAYDRWNVDRYGGRSTLYQGDAHGSGPLTGIAVYGDQLANLGAISIDQVDVGLSGVGLSGGVGPATVQGTAQGTAYPGAPVGSGPTAAGEGWVNLPLAVGEGMRTGAIKGLVLVGGSYYAVAGAGNGTGMVLRVIYTRHA